MAITTLSSVSAAPSAKRRSASRSTGLLIVRRIRDGVLVLLLVLTAVFALGQLVGDPAESLAPADATHTRSPSAPGLGICTDGGAGRWGLFCSAQQDARR